MHFCTDSPIILTLSFHWTSSSSKPQRGRLMHDLVEIEETMASVENKHEEGLLNHVKEAAESSSVKQVGD